MNADQLVKLLGMTDADTALSQAVKANGGSVDSLSPKKMREILTDFINLVDAGVVLAFVPREVFSEDYGDPLGSGEYALDGVIYYPNGSSSVSSYGGAVPYATGPIRNRDEALAAFGTPKSTQQVDGTTSWDLWSKDEIVIKVDYKSGTIVKNVLFSLPRKY
ncbi:hypothetical protein [Roseateles terrae]|uniref:Uncharacterized protein n=1 Tax=Roseateles terrae TaxID=431060 RepID=A0ABR6GTC0_9BURK|nr:hypothetical protein [Roseateles terrae]MBB3195365.1 hypothetical protein [Roseateles terrae]